MIVRFKFRYCQVHMARFLSGDLSDATRRRVARYIDECEDCYREFMHQREFAHKLQRNLPVLGRPESDRLDQIWNSLQADLGEPITYGRSFTDFGSRTSLQCSYGLVVFALIIALLLPLMTGDGSPLLSISLARAPQLASIELTPAPYQSQMNFSSVTALPSQNRRTPLLQNTPSPRL